MRAGKSDRCVRGERERQISSGEVTGGREDGKREAERG